MPDRWIRFCRRLVPAPLRGDAFDPAVQDHAIDFAARISRASSRFARGRLAVRWRLAVLGDALECRRLALRRSPHVPAAERRRRDSMLLTWLGDVRHALRRFRHQPMFALVAVLTLALGIGANVAIFGFVNSYLLGLMPVPQPEALVRVYDMRAGRFDVGTYPNYVDLRDAGVGIDLAVHVMTQVTLGADANAESRSIELVSGNYFRVMRITPVAGRLLDPRDDEAEGAHAVAAIGEGLWRSHFNADPAIVGQSVRLNGFAYTVVGIVPERFRGSAGIGVADLWAPIAMQQQLRPRGRNRLDQRGWGFLSMIGRLTTGATIDSVRPGLDRVSADLNRQYSQRNGVVTFAIVPARTLPESNRRSLAPYLYITSAFTALLLAVTCANLAGVMQARVIARRRELAIRQSLGAGRWRVASEWLTECALLAVAGGVVGTLVARLTMLAVVRLPPIRQMVGQTPLDAPVDLRVAAYAGALSLGAALLFGLMPALRAAAQQPLALLKEEATTAAGGRRRSALRQTAVFLQVAVSAALLVVSALLAVSLRHMQTFDVGFRSDHLAMVSVDLKFQRVPPGEYGPYTSALMERARALPGVAAVAAAVDVPLGGGQDAYGFKIPGYTPPPGKTSVSIDTNIVSASYFDTLGLTFVKGGPWRAGAPERVMVINETMAARFWPGRDPVGQPAEFIGNGPLTVAGVVRDSTNYQIGETPIPYAYLPIELAPQPSYVLAVRTTGAPEDLLPSLGGAVRATDPRARPVDPTTFEDARKSQLYPRRLLALTATIFGLVALVLTCIGLYGVVSHSVGQRTREIGVRVALGARPGQIQGRVLAESGTIVAAGALAGLAGGYALTGALKQWLFGVSPFDAGVYGSVALALAAVAMAAGWVPARRASRIDPVLALRQ